MDQTAPQNKIFWGNDGKVTTGDGNTALMPLYPRSVADFYTALFDLLRGLGIDVRIYGKPNEISGAIPFREDHIH
jgi:hypothetical protein